MRSCPNPAPSARLRARRLVAVVLLAPPLVVGATVAATGAPTSAGAASRVRPVDRAAAPYARSGPFVAGVTTVQLSDRAAEVWYPAPRTARRAPRDEYDLLDATPPVVQALLPPGTDLRFTTAARRDVAGSPRGPFPLVVLVHGAAGYRQQLSYLASHLATWGFVVASPDVLERGLATLLGSPAPPARDDVDVARETETRVRAVARDPGSRLAGAVRRGPYAITGQSLGGLAAVRTAAVDPRVRTFIPISAGARNRRTGESFDLADRPSLWVTATDDSIVPAAEVAGGYRRAVAPARFVSVGRLAHASITDICAIGGPGALPGVADRAGLPVPETIKRVAGDGCDVAPDAIRRAHAAVGHFVTAQLRWAFGIDRRPVGLDRRAAKAFAPVPVDYRQRPAP